MSYIGNDPNDIELLISSDYKTNSKSLLANTECVNKLASDLLSEFAGGNKKIGEIFIFSGSNKLNGALELNGQVILNCNTSYPAFYDWVTNYAQIKTLTEYQTIYSNNGNSCGYFGVDTTAKTIKLPTIKPTTITGVDYNWYICIQTSFGTISDSKYNDIYTEINDLRTAINNKSSTKTTSVTIPSTTTYTDKVCSVTVDGITESTVLLVSPNPNSISAWSSSGMYCSGQGTNSLSFTCTTIPTSDITINIIIF